MPFSASEKIKNAIPWFVKIPAKIVLSRVPIGSRRWQRFNIFRAGEMDTPASAFGIFKKHLEGAGLTTLVGQNVLELGPGNSLLTALYAKSFGAFRTWLVDAERLASEDVALFAKAEQTLLGMGLPTPSVSTAPSMSVALEQLKATYLTTGLASLQSIPDRDVDFFFSNAVLEHVRLTDFENTANEMRRVLKPTGVASHQVDFRDHLQNGLNNLRFSGRMWESEFMARSGFYTNRLTWPAMEKLFQSAGLDVKVHAIDHWPDQLPTRQSSMALPFKEMPPRELMVKGVHVVLRPLN